MEGGGTKQDEEWGEASLERMEEDGGSTMLHSLKNALKGTTVLPKPYVSREVMVAALQGQNKILLNLFKGMTESKARISALTTRSMEMEEMIGTRDKRLKDQEDLLRCQQERLDDLQTTVEVFKAKADLFDEIQSQVKEMQEGLDELKVTVKEQEGGGEELRNFRESAGRRLEIAERNIGMMPQTIEISPQQVRMDEPDLSDPEHRSNKTTLLQVFNAVRAMVDTHDYDISALRKEVKKEIDQQANVLEETKQRVTKMEKLQDEFQEVKRNMDICLEALEDLKANLSTKVNGHEVDDKIEERYEDIVDNLMKALKNVQDDEDDFKQATQDLYAALDNIKTDKADKGELEFIKLKVQKMSEETTKMDPELLHSIQKRLTKEEVEEMMEDKVNRDELTTAIDDLNKTLVKYANRLRRMGPGESDRKLLGGLARTLKLTDGGSSSARAPSSRQLIASYYDGGGGGGSSSRNLSTAGGGRRGSREREMSLEVKDARGGKKSSGRSNNNACGGINGIEEGEEYDQAAGMMMMEERCDHEVLLDAEGDWNDNKMQYQRLPPQPSGLAFAESIFPSKGGKAKATTLANTKICLACHSEVPNPPREKQYAGASYGGGFQILLPAGGVKGPPMRTAVSSHEKSVKGRRRPSNNRGADGLVVVSSPPRRKTAPDIVSL